MHLRPLSALVSLLLFLSAGAAQGDQFERFGDLEVHYNVFNSTSISAAMSERYGLKRGETIAYVNVAGRRRREDGTTSAVTLELEGEVANLIGQTRPMDFLLVEEPGAVYYILTTRFSDRETLRFRLQVTDTETNRTYPMEFQKELWKQ
ncbi:MAG: DUF4426 domain-containing protein [Pseudomonadota bacterium]|nr:DUF4426 domain-containing protein [Pseudomonadota bacterium]